MISPNSTFPLQNESSEKEDISSLQPSGQNKLEGEDIIKKGGTFRQRLLTTILPTTLIPLIVASSITINITSYRAERDELNRLEEIAILGEEITGRYFQNALRLKEELQTNPLIIQAIEDSSQIVESQGLLQQSIPQLESNFAQNKLLIPNVTLNNYLKGLSDSRGISEIIITDPNGFNVAYSSTPSDFVQSDEQWWQIGSKEGEKILNSVFDESINTVVVETVSTLNEFNNGAVFGVAKISVSVQTLQETLANLLNREIVGTTVLQIIDGQTGNLLNSIAPETLNISTSQIVGGEVVTQVAKVFLENQSNNNLLELQNQLNQIPNLSNIDVRERIKGEDLKVLTFQLNGRFFKMLSIPETNFLGVISVDQSEIYREGNQLAFIFGSLAFFLAILAIASIILLAQNFSEPLTNLTNKAKQVAQGNLEVEATLEGTEENRILAYNFNGLVKRVKQLIQEQEAIANQQIEEKEKLEMGIYQLLEDLQDAVDGDLTVRASLSSMEMSTVADLCNAILDSLQDIASQVQKSSKQVISALEKDEQSIKELTKEAIEENYKTMDTLVSVKNMSETIAKIAQSANQAATLADDAYSATEESSKGMDATVNTIVSLRNTVGETAKKMKRLGESSQKISQVVSLIEEIALKTNLLAINASVEASRAGEQGQGFTVVAEQVGALAEQSASATKEIAKIVAEIQRETQEVTNAMESGTTQVVNTTQLVETTKQQLEQVLTRSRNINQLMQSISQSTVSQAQTSQTVQELMEQIAYQSEERLDYSQKIVESIQATSQIAQQLESAVEQFKVSEENTVIN
ncbi:methyl-accepting chemotaxis protein [Cyanobacterium aponinum]|uniref:Methyl-accepting chemotaxis sensory transducer n=1 Tax=Cyanobacterium aponinum (strain PCC 10605) TaxID=755178 RepID=K9Z7U0_CYAAP|nr:methyl-accepting chemotaxis protein [Cyanobacterium aponinum]AFZ55251.1 methyl-accepting chemotaxis sensory transducer [Cyanobacterium aponinum PCC 10605]